MENENNSPTENSTNNQSSTGVEAKEAHSFDPIMGQLIPTFNFLVFALLAYFFLRGPIRKAMASRKQAYLGLKAEAEKLKREADAQLAEVNQRYGSLEKEVAEIIARGTEDALKERERILEDARALARHIETEAKRIVATELAQARKALQQEIMGSLEKEMISKISAELSGERGQKYSQSLVSNIPQA
jgi:F0F1-type ATP synthase membrane subunit b/b'